MKYYPMHMHLHSIHQPGASMASHMYNAKSLGMEYIHFTDHDTRMGRKSVPVDGFDFSRGEIKYLDCKDEGRGWRTVGDPVIEFSEDSMLLSSSGGETAGISFYSDGKRHTWALLSEITLVFGFQYELSEGSRIVFDVTLSQRPPEHKEAHYRYVIGKPSEKSSHLFREVPMPKPLGKVYTLKLSDDMSKEDALGGLDNTFSTVSIYLEGEGRIAFNSFKIDHKYEYNDLVLKQRALAEKIGESLGIKPFVTSEISGAGQHKNCFTSSVPIINYYERDYRMSEEEACDYLKSYGAVFSYNHPFEAERYKRKQFTREDIENIIALETEKLAKNRVYGASVMEVGFPEGRGLFSLGDYLKLWDNLALCGVFITGDGDSDSHYSDRSWFDNNNFATWIAADDALEFPIGEEIFNRSLLSGNCYMGDPTRLTTGVSFFSKEAMMGSVVRCYGEEQSVTLRLDSVKEGLNVKFIKNGEEYLSESTSEGVYERTVAFTPLEEISFIRCELYDSDGRCIMLTNPIYFVKQEYRGYVQRERAWYIGSDAQKKDEELMNSSYEKNIDLPEWIYSIKGKKVLHIGDTESWRYHYYRRLIDLVAPDVIIHTGDLADEVKAGRMSEAYDEYAFKLGILSEILNSSGAELYAVPGNNDIEELIRELLPKATVVRNDTVINIDGTDVRVGHQVSSMTFDKKWSFYGHGFTGDDYDPKDNRVGSALRFNACNGPTLVSLSDEKFYQFSLKGVK